MSPAEAPERVRRNWNGARRLRSCVQAMRRALYDIEDMYRLKDWHGMADNRAAMERWAIEAVTALAEWAGEP